jgi:hypothetical protein
VFGGWWLKWYSGTQGPEFKYCRKKKTGEEQKKEDTEEMGRSQTSSQQLK